MQRHICSAFSSFFKTVLKTQWSKMQSSRSTPRCSSFAAAAARTPMESGAPVPPPLPLLSPDRRLADWGRRRRPVGSVRRRRPPPPAGLYQSPRRVGLHWSRNRRRLRGGLPAGKYPPSIPHSSVESEKLRITLADFSPFNLSGPARESKKKNNKMHLPPPWTRSISA